MSRTRAVVICLLLLVLAAAHVLSQENCPQLSVPQIIPGTNMFNAQQEVWLGNAEAASVEQSLTIIDEPQLTAYLQQMVDGLAQSLGSTQLQFRVKIYDAPTGQAFSLAGGRIYVSRKLIALTRNEDEVAGILAHEMGHSVAHHEAIARSESFRKVLGLKEVSDQADVTARWNELVSNYRRMKAGSYEKAVAMEEREQVQADAIALYLVARAGYSPQSFFDIFDRTAQTKSNIGGFWSNLFGRSSPDSRRLARIIKDTPAMLKTCINTRTENATVYDRWKTGVIEYPGLSATHQESLPGLVSKRVLTERLRPEVQRIRISPDGKYVLAQDDGNVFVLEREPLTSIFHFEAHDAGSAQFTPDSRGIVLLFDDVRASPRVERWDIASQKRAEVHEVYVRDGCLLSKVAPDGKTLTCLTREFDSAGFMKFNLDLYDVATATSFVHKKGWVDIDLAKMLRFGGWQELPEFLAAGQKLLEALSPMAFSCDAHYFVAHSRQNTLAFDLFSRNKMDLPGNIKGLLDYSFTFLANGNLIGVAGGNGEKSEVVEFPSGRVIYKDLNIGGSRLEAVAQGDHVLLRPIKDHPVGIFDLKQNKIVVASKRSAITVWDDSYIAERLDGELQVFDIPSFKPVERAQLPDAPLGNVHASAISPDLTWLAISQKTRGAVWNLQTGQRLYHVRGFSAAYFSPDGGLYADFPKYLSTERTLARAALNSEDMRPERAIDEKNHTIEAGRYLLTITPAKTDNPRNDVSFELWDIIDKKVVWTKEFSHEGPAYHVDSRANVLALYWKASSQSAKSIGKDDPAAAAAMAHFKDRDSAVFVLIFDLDTGKLRGQTAFDTGNHSIQIETVKASADRLIVADGNSRVLVYSFDGQVQGTIAGHSPQISAKSDLLTVRTASGELELYDLRDARKRTRYEFQNRVAFDGFNADGTRLLVLTSDQTVYILDTAPKKDSAVVSK